MTETDPATDYGAPPRGGWARLVCELLVEDLTASRAFWEGLLGFGLAYQRPEQGRPKAEGSRRAIRVVSIPKRLSSRFRRRRRPGPIELGAQ